MRCQRLLLVLFLLACGCSVAQKKHKPTEKPTFFVPVLITKLSSFQTPCVHVRLEEKTLLLKLDLGFQGDMTIEKEVSDLLAVKEFVGERSTYGIRGKEYKKKAYQIPKATISAMTFSPLIVEEENAEFLQDAEFLENGEESTPKEEHGRLGWSLFYNANLLVDVQNSKIAFADSLETLKKEGYAVESWIKAPLFLENGLLECKVETPRGTLQCVLDTGATWNVLNAESELLDIVECPFLKIENVDFGPTCFRAFSIRMPLQIDAILGMEFFKDHLVFLDFAKKLVYFSK